jgi:hypothetical protein
VHAIGVPEEDHERSTSPLEEVFSTDGTPAIKSFERLEKACEVQDPSLYAPGRRGYVLCSCIWKK